MNGGNDISNHIRRALVLLVAPLCATTLFGRTLPADPSQLMREVIENELQAESADHSSWRYLERLDEEKKSEVLEVIGTPDGFVFRRLTVNGALPNSEAESRRMRKLLNDPAKLEHEWRAERSDAEKLRALMRMLPDAFLCRYDQEEAVAGHVRMSLTPNPDFHPTTISAEIFRHLEGYIDVEPQAKRLVAINARLVSNAKFGDGILGHLDRGGTVVFRQEDVGDGHWQPVFIEVNMHGRLLFLSLSLNQRIVDSDYEQLPDDMTPKQIISMMINDLDANARPAVIGRN